MGSKKEEKEEFKLLKPSEIKEYLDQYVIGQDKAKKILSIAVYNHFKKIINNNNNSSDTEMDKSNIILIGETGSGKTLLAKTIAKLLNVPCYIQDCTKITQSGYVGSDVEDCLVGLLRSCDYNVQLAEMGIVVLDEIDKNAKKDVGMSNIRDVSGEGVQQSLLKIAEGDLVGVPPAGGRKHPDQPLIYVNTKNILFIASGAFVGLEEIVKKRMGGRGIGFDSYDETIDMSNEDILSYVSTQDLKDYGLIPEFIGRFPIVTHVNKLSEESLIKILTEPKNALVKQYKELMLFDNVMVNFDDDALKEIASVSYKMGTGARGLRNIMEVVLEDIMYNIPDKKTTVTVTKNMVTEKTKQLLKGIRKNT